MLFTYIYAWMTLDIFYGTLCYSTALFGVQSNISIEKSSSATYIFTYSKSYSRHELNDNLLDRNLLVCAVPLDYDVDLSQVVRYHK